MRVPVKNLAAVSPNLSVGLLQEAVGWQFLRTNVQGEDDGYENSRGFQMIRPDNDWFPGLDQLRADFISHQWVFGKTPKFKVSKKFQVPQTIFDDICNVEEMMIEIEVNKGVIVDVRLKLPPGLLDPELMDLSEVLLKMDFDGKLVQNFAARLEAYVELSTEKKDFFIQSLDEMIRNFV